MRVRSDCILCLCIPFILSLSSNEAGHIRTCSACVTANWRLSLQVPLAACNKVPFRWIKVDPFARATRWQQRSRMLWLSRLGQRSSWPSWASQRSAYSVYGEKLGRLGRRPYHRKRLTRLVGLPFKISSSPSLWGNIIGNVGSPKGAWVGKWPYYPGEVF